MADVELNVTGSDDGGISLLRAMKIAVDVLAKSEAELAKVQDRVAAAEAKLNAARASGNQQKIAAATGVLTRAQTALAVAENKVNNATALQQQVMDRLGGSVNKATGEISRNTSAMSAQQNVAKQLSFEVKSLIAQFLGFKAIAGFVETGIEFNRVIETAALGIGSLIAAQSDLITSDGKLLKGTDAIEVAMGLARGQIDKLRVAGLQTAATTVQLVDAFEQAVGVGLTAGLTLDQIRKFTVETVQASAALGVRMDQINQEVRSILDGTIDRNSRVAKAIQLSNQQVRLAREEGRLADLLNEKFAAFDAAGIKAVSTFTVLKGNIADAVAVFAGATTKPLFDNIKEAALTALKDVFDFSSADITDSFRGLVETGKILSQEVGSALAAGIRTVVNLAKEFSEWLRLHRVEVVALAESFGSVLRQIGNIVLQFLLVIGDTIKWGTETGVLQVLLNDVATIARVIANNMGIILGLVTAISAISIANPYTLALTAAALLLGILVDVNDQSKVQQALALRRIQNHARETAEVVKLSSEYEQLAHAVQTNKLNGQDLVNAQERMKSLLRQLSDLAPEWRSHLEDEKKTTGELAAEVRKLTQARLNDLNIQLAVLQIRQEEARAAVKAEQDKLQPTTTVDRFGEAHVTPAPKTSKALQTAKQDLQAINDQINALLDAAIRAGDAIDEANKAADTIIKGHPLPPTKKELDDAAQAAQGRLALIKQAVKTIQQILDQADADQLISKEQFLEASLQLDKREIEAEKDVIRAKLAAATDKGLQAQLIGQLKALDQKQLEAEAEKNKKLEAFQRSFQETRRKLITEDLNLTGDVVEAEAREISERYRKALLDAFREGDFAMVGIINDIITRQIAQKQFAKFEQDIGIIEDELQNRLEQIANQKDVGKIGEILANQLNADALDAAREKIQRVVEELIKLHPLLKDDPKFIQFIDDINTRLDTMAAKTAHVNDLAFELGQTLKDQFVNGIVQVAGDITDASNSIGEAFKNMARNIVRALNEVIAKMIALKIVEAAIGIFGGGLPAAPDVPAIQPGDIPQIASGGWISGPGDGTRDTTLALLANREFVVNARSATANADLLEAINAARGPFNVRNRWRNRFPSFAEGGPVKTHLTGELGLHLDEGLLANKMESFMRSPKGEEIFVRVYGRTKSRRKGIP